MENDTPAPPPHARPASGFWMRTPVPHFFLDVCVAFIMIVMTFIGNLPFSIVPHSGTSLMLLALSLLLSACSAVAVASLVWRWCRWLAPLVKLAAMATAFMPVTALTWAFIGAWIGRLGWPLETLACHSIAESAPWHLRLAATVWAWAPAVLLVTAPATGCLTAVLLDALRQDFKPELATSLKARGISPVRQHYGHTLPRLRPRLARALVPVGAFSLLNLCAVEHLLAMDGWGAMAAAWIGGDRGSGQSVFTIAASGVCLFSVWWLVCNRLRRRDPAHEAAARDCTRTTPREAALMLGVEPFSAWLRHEGARWLRRIFATVLVVLAWLIVISAGVTSLSGHWPGAEITQAAAHALEHPEQALIPGARIMVCALSLALLSRIIRPRS